MRRTAIGLSFVFVALSCGGGKLPSVSVGIPTGGFPGSTGDVIKIINAVQSVAEAFEDLTPEQEHYIGRAVAAEILAKHRVYRGAAAVEYVNLVGQTLALASDRPETFAGYHFFILDTNDINALAAPGGLIFVTRGMLRLCETEDQLAAVLAHEVAHVQDRHGIRAIKQSKQWSAFSKIAFENIQEVQQALNTIGVDLSTNLFKHGYSRKLEREADERGLQLMRRVGYQPHAMLELLGNVRAKLGDRKTGRSHPHLEDRIDDAKGKIKQSKQPRSARRASRYDAALAGTRAP